MLVGAMTILRLSAHSVAGPLSVSIGPLCNSLQKVRDAGNHARRTVEHLSSIGRAIGKSVIGMIYAHNFRSMRLCCTVRSLYHLQHSFIHSR